MRFETPLAARAAVRALTASKIRELYNEGLGKPDVLPFWVGEPDQPTPDFIRKAGMDSIAAGRFQSTSRKRSSSTAAGTASGSLRTTPTSGCTSERAGRRRRF